MTNKQEQKSDGAAAAAANLRQERDALRDEVEGLRSAVDTVMRALKIALREHNEARMREAILIDLLRQSESECRTAHDLLRRCQSCLAADSPDAVALRQEIEVALSLEEDASA